jgi:MFS family permease/HAMP domain-containing protein
MRFAALSLATRVMVLATGTVLAALIAVNAIAFAWFENALVPALQARTAAAARGISGPLARALNLGVPLAQLRGVDEALQTVLRADPDLGFAMVVGPDATVRVGTAPAADCLVVESSIPGHDSVIVRIGILRSAIANRQTGTLLDLGIIAIVALLVTCELLAFVISQALVNPQSRLRDALVRGRNGDLTTTLPAGADESGAVAAAWNAMRDRLTAARSSDNRPTGLLLHGPSPPEDPYRSLYRIRLPLFLLIFSEAISLSFLPLFAKSLTSGTAGAVMLSLPITAFMVFWGLSQPFAGTWSDRVGRRTSLLTGMVMAAVGLAMSGFASSLWELTTWRALSGVGYGIGFITATAYVQDHTSPANRGRGMGMFVWAFSAGTLCGSSIGGVLADRLGYQATFCISSALVSIGVLATAWCIRDYRPDRARPALRGRDLVRLGANARFAALSLFAAIPPKFIITGINAFTLPIYLSGLGLNQAAIGRTLMAFNLATIVCSGICAGWADRLGSHRSFVIAGGLIAAGALAVASGWHSATGILVSVTLLGVANGVGQAPLLALVPTAAPNEAKELGPGTVMGVFRLVERIGSVIGPVVAGMAMVALGFSGTMLGVAGMCLVTIVLFAAMPLFLAWLRPGAEDARA